MKILMITPYLPYPLVSGGQIRTYNLLKQIRSEHEVILLSFIREDGELKYLPELKKFCREIYTFKKLKPFSIANIFRAGFTSYPALMTMYLSRHVAQIIERIIKNEKIDLIHAETFYVMSNLPKTHVPQLLVEQTIEFKVYQSFISKINLWPLKKILEIDVKKIKKWEKLFWQQASKVVAMSEADRGVMLQESKKLDVDIVPNGVDVAFFSKIKKKKHSNPTVLFLGNFKWIQNKEAVIYLKEKVWPLIYKKLPQAQLWIVGKNPSSEILAMAGPQIKVEEAENISDVFAQADILLAPMLSGGGTRYKILEAMASSTPIVATSLGVEGLDVKHNREVFIGNTEEELANLSVQILENENFSRKVVENARKLISQNYNWDKIGKKLNDIYTKVGAKE